MLGVIEIAFPHGSCRAICGQQPLDSKQVNSGLRRQTLNLHHWTVCKAGRSASAGDLFTYTALYLAPNDLAMCSYHKRSSAPCRRETSGLGGETGKLPPYFTLSRHEALNAFRLLS
jgi:hypothetical protein